MKTKELLACATPEAIQYIQDGVNLRNKTDYQKLKKLFDKQQFEAKSFDDSELDISNFDWISLERDRNWWWQLQALPFLNWFTSSLELQTEEERSRYFSLCLDAIQCWVRNAKLNKDSPLAWHDHASAFRVRNLTNWLLFCCTSGLPVGQDARAEPLASLVVEHLDWLGEDKNYSKRTNHGFDQAMIALTIGLMFSRENFEQHRQLNRKRLIDEVTFAFTDEGVHKENSPGYQKMMLGRLKQLRNLTLLGEEQVSALGEHYIGKAEVFLKAITLPNGYLPMIGDTRGDDEGLTYEQINEIDFLDYSNSGYVIVRGVVLGRDFHLVFKASHLSHYHRHDDDLSIHLYYDGKVLLGDGGLGSHNEKDKKRISLRSSLAHNAPYIVGAKAARKVEQLQGRLPRVYLTDTHIVGESYCFGIPLRRELGLSRLIEGKLSIKDKVAGSGGHELATNFYSSAGLYESQGQLLTSIDDKYEFKVHGKNNMRFKEKLAYFSDKFGSFMRLACFSAIADEKNEVEVEIDLHHPKLSLHEISYRGFGPIRITETGNWFFDDDYPSNVCHHILSLRWLGEVKSESVKKRIFSSFVAYHEFSEQRKSKYYLGKQADHTASIRLVVLLELLNVFKTDEALAASLKRELLKNIRSCLKETYKENNNHGLMVDKAILQCLFEDSDLLKKHENDVGFVIARMQKQLDGIFDKDGFCKEHSISYQEYNLGTALGLLEIMKKGAGLGFDDQITDLYERVGRIKEASRKALGFLLKDDGTYITVGDSFPEPKSAILNKAFGSKDPHIALYPESKEEGFFYNGTLGVSVYRSAVIHLVFNASWHSYVHKQNDDLSIYLRVNGEDVFVEGGYSDLITRDEINTMSEYLHSTIIPDGKSWLRRGETKKGFSRMNVPCFDTARRSCLFSAAHTRVEGAILERKIEIMDTGQTLKIIDTATGEGLGIIRHRLIINSQFNIDFVDKEVFLSSKNNKISISYDDGDKGRGWETGFIDVVSGKEIKGLRFLDFVSEGRVFFEIKILR